MKSATAAHAPHAEHLHGLPFSCQVDTRFVPVDLSLLSPAVALRNKGFVYNKSHLTFSPPYISANAGLSYRLIRQLRSDPLINPVTGMPLFSRRFPICFQNCVNKRDDTL